MAADERYDDRLTAILVDEAARWDGVLRDERGRKIGTLVLAYVPTPRPTYTIAAECPLGFPADATYEANGASRRLTASVEGWYGETWALKEQWLREGLRLEAKEFVLAYRPSAVVPLSRNHLLGCWASVPRIEPGEKYLVLVDSTHAAEVETFLRENARDEWKQETDAFAPPGWVLFAGVVIEESLINVPPGPLAVLAPRLRERPTLKGGLPVDGAVSLYLCGGEPDLWLPSLLDPTTVVRVDGTDIDATAGQRLSLAALRLPGGAHEINVGAATVRFSTTRDFRDGPAPGVGTLGHNLVRRDGYYEAASAGARPLGAGRTEGEVAVTGAHLVGPQTELPASRPTIVLPLEGQRYRVVGATPGAVIEPRQPTRPGWLDNAGHGALFPIGFEVSPDFDAVWVVVERPGRITARLRRRVPPADTDAGASLEINEWCSVFDLEPDLCGDELDMWLQYRAVAAAIPKLSPADVTREREKKQALSQTSPKRRTPTSVQPKPALVVEGLITLTLQYRTSDRHAYESRDKRFQITYWPKQRSWTVTERLSEKSRDKTRLGRFATEADALFAVRRAVHTIHTVRREEAR